MCYCISLMRLCQEFFHGAFSKREEGSGLWVVGCGLWWQLRCNIYGAMPEGKWIAGFPFGISKHWPPGREWQRFLASLEMTIRSSALHSWHTDRCVEGCLFEAHLSCAFVAPLLQGATRMACNTVLSFLFLRIYSHTSAAKILRLRFR